MTLRSRRAPANMSDVRRFVHPPKTLRAHRLAGYVLDGGWPLEPHDYERRAAGWPTNDHANGQWNGTGNRATGRCWTGR